MNIDNKCPTGHEGGQVLRFVLQRTHGIILQLTSGGSERSNTTVTQPGAGEARLQRLGVCPSVILPQEPCGIRATRSPIHGGTSRSNQHRLKQENHLANWANVSDRKYPVSKTQVARRGWRISGVGLGSPRSAT